MRETLSKPLGTVLITGAFLATGVAGIVAAWGAWPRTDSTSPLMALFVLLWSCAAVLTAVLTWRRSRLAGLAFLAAVGLLLFPARFLVPGGELFLPALAVVMLVAFLGFRYLRRTGAALS